MNYLIIWGLCFSSLLCSAQKYRKLSIETTGCLYPNMVRYYNFELEDAPTSCYSKWISTCEFGELIRAYNCFFESCDTINYNDAIIINRLNSTIRLGLADTVETAHTTKELAKEVQNFYRKTHSMYQDIPIYIPQPVRVNPTANDFVCGKHYLYQLITLPLGHYLMNSQLFNSKTREFVHSLNSPKIFLIGWFGAVVKDGEVTIESRRTNKFSYDCYYKLIDGNINNTYDVYLFR